MTNAPRTSVLVIGESIVDVLRVGQSETRSPGGSPLNVAVGLGRLEVPVSLLTRIGPDPDGEILRTHLDAAGVRLLGASVGEERTSTAMATIGIAGAAEYTFDIAWSLPPVTAVPPCTGVHVGSLGTFLHPGAESVVGLLRSLPQSVTISYDPNIRSSLLPDHEAALARFEEIAALSYLAKMSEEDCAWLYPERTEDEVIEHVLGLGPSLFGMTRGDAGAVLATADVRADVPARSVDVVDTVGAGDSFMSALVWALLTGTALDGAGLHHLASIAAVAAGITCSRAGAAPPSLSELRAEITAAP